MLGSRLANRAFSEEAQEGFVFVQSVVIIAPFGFFQAQMDDVFWQAFEPLQADLCQPPKPLYAVDMHADMDECVLGMVDAIMAVHKVHQAAIAALPNRVYHRFRIRT